MDVSHPALVAQASTLPEPAAADHLARLRAGDGEALGEAYRRHAAGLLALVYRLTGSAEDAEDVIQDLFVGLPEAVRQYREQGRFESWLRRIAVRLALMRMRAGRRRREVALEPGGDSLPSQSSSPGDDLYLWNELQQLPEEARAIVVLRVVEGYSHEEVAELLGIRRGAAQVRYHRALNQLRSMQEAR
jgi:RNA polymerase sigma-70 factor (ECF subfamily)